MTVSYQAAKEVKFEMTADIETALWKKKTLSLLGYGIAKMLKYETGFHNNSLVVSDSFKYHT